MANRITRRCRPTSGPHNVAVLAEATTGLPVLDAPAQFSVCLLSQVFQEQRVHRPLEPDVRLRLGCVAMQRFASLCRAKRRNH